ncbi:hypothetical protein CEXT_321551 [Caerostris extrusa]|uniref:Uncharacterized protein n=1 Tax=Caerostris extrusa TaxID=172846 RepID=A0AAV4MEP9_CAEEX|nr:hypothetical protein CEXT_321551 [Caerostris extrusa]
MRNLPDKCFIIRMIEIIKVAYARTTVDISRTGATCQETEGHMPAWQKVRQARPGQVLSREASWVGSGGRNRGLFI